MNVNSWLVKRSHGIARHLLGSTTCLDVTNIYICKTRPNMATFRSPFLGGRVSHCLTVNNFISLSAIFFTLDPRGGLYKEVKWLVICKHFLRLLKSLSIIKLVDANGALFLLERRDMKMLYIWFQGRRHLILSFHTHLKKRERGNCF